MKFLKSIAFGFVLATTLLIASSSYAGLEADTKLDRQLEQDNDAPASHRAPYRDLVHVSREAHDWSSFDHAMEDLRGEEHRTGISYVVSGSLVTIGSTIAPFSTNDTASKFIYGIAQGVGVAAIGYGVAKLADSSEFDSFYESLKNSTIREDQKTALVRSYLERERQRRETIRKINFYSHLGLGALNVYSAIAEKDRTTKVFMGFLATVNFALALTFEF